MSGEVPASPEAVADPAAFVVIDASVALKWVFDDEDHVTEATSLRDAWLGGRFQAVAPSLWQYEVLNGLVIAVRKKRLPRDKGQEAMGYLSSLGLLLADPGSDSVYRCAADHGLTAYDAAYVALAEELQADLWTGDRRLHNTVGGKIDRVRWIADWENQPPTPAATGG